MTIVPASQNSFALAIDLLKKNNLPTEDLNPGTQLFVAEEDNRVIGSVAVEYNYTEALLRSLCVDASYKNKGLGKELVSFIERYVQLQGVQTIFILTTTAAGFFSKIGYERIDRENAPAFIQNTSEFSTVCASSAVLMKKSGS